LEDIVKGVTRVERVSLRVPCQACAATGVEPGSAPQVCSRCRGAGRMRRNLGFLQVETECPDCRGMGRREEPCRQCRGEGRRPGHERLRFRIPPGVRAGAKIRYQGKGHAGRRGGARGHLFVLVRVRRHKMFRREADDLVVRANLTLPELLLGTELEVTGITGEAIAVAVPAGSIDGDEVRVRGKGLPGLRGGHGDLRVVLRAERSKLNPKAKAALTDLAAAIPPVHRRFDKP
ncbi:molecular chaperone DnaJ, partial [bacterium]|nr:molecular chaperone DnaJ [bacterium]